MAKKLTKRKGFSFLRSYFDVLNELEKDKDKLEFLLAIINKQFLDEDPKGLNFLVNLCYESQRHQIESSVNGWKKATNDTLGTTTPTPLWTTPPTPKEEEEEEEKEKEKPNIEARKLAFKDLIQKFINDNPKKYHPKLYKDFYLYWSEHGVEDKKMRFEKQTSFDISRRLGTWFKNDFNNEYKEPEQEVRITMEEYKRMAK